MASFHKDRTLLSKVSFDLRFFMGISELRPLYHPTLHLMSIFVPHRAEAEPKKKRTKMEAKNEDEEEEDFARSS